MGGPERECLADLRAIIGTNPGDLLSLVTLSARVYIP